MTLSLSQILHDLLNRLIQNDSNSKCSHRLTDILFHICQSHVDDNVIEFQLDEQATNGAIQIVEDSLRKSTPNYAPLSQSISYLLDELTCNIQQHSQAEYGFISATYNNHENLIEIVLADHGISIYGSYVQTQKYLELIGNSDAEALGLAKDGYSTKNRPDAENRGYGISSNTKMVTKGLDGEFAIYSGTALFIQTPTDTKLLELPEQLDMKGTVVVVRIPASIPDNYNFYEYIS